MKIVPLLRTGVLWCAALSTIASSAQAAQDIVYSARYYNRPGSKGTSHYQLYRINADGSKRRQITTGNLDSLYPQWSPDRKKILFVRRDEKTSRDTLSLVNASGGAVTRLREFATTDLYYYRWSRSGDVIAVAFSYQMPHVKRDFHAAILIDLKGRTQRVYRDAYGIMWSSNDNSLFVLTNKGQWARQHPNNRTPTRYLDSALFLDSQTVIELFGPLSSPSESTTTLRNLKISTISENDQQVVSRESQVTLKFKNESEWDDIPASIALLSKRPLSQRTLVIAYDIGDSTIDPLYKFCLADIKSGRLKTLAEGQFLEWAPDGQKFCTAPGQDLSQYDRKRKVWTAPLQVGQGTSGKFKNIVSGLVHVVGADWR